METIDDAALDSGPDSAHASRTADIRHGLNLIAAAQEALRTACWIDENANGTGEYGFLDELTGCSDLPGNPERSVRDLQPDLVGAFEDTGTRGIFLRNGYCFLVFLPDANGRGVGGLRRTRSVERPDPALCEGLWACYAWPAYHGVTGTHAFFMRSDGEILVTANESRRYSGVDNPPPPSAAFPASSGGIMNGRLSANALAIDGQHWVREADAPRQEFVIEVRDERGQPIGGLELAVVDPRQLHRHPWFRPGDEDRLAANGQVTAPCGSGVSDAAGAVRLRGWSVRGMAVAVLGCEGRPIPAAGCQVRAHEGGLSIRLSAADSRRARVEVGERQALATLERLASDRGALADSTNATEPVARGGYLFELHRNGSALPSGGTSYWYAWPQVHGSTGIRTFMASANGDIVACNNDRQRYSGPGMRPDPKAAFTLGPWGRLVEARFVGGPALDGDTWRRVR